ncbi:type II toxin-antitoxin system RelE/ParE family toxin [Rhodoferax sp.]|uniref:type II toxin-antitoxin system RelE/ParE family toxin n=1 Tax=Rhodoferax sp. TaxID=50421 RepID=UPI003BB4D392|nr:type II toxin-antitoxin system RelE/ParE family toxin [Rhodoferax sp.]
MKRIVLFTQATHDLERAFDYYFDVANLQVAERLRDAVTEALDHIQRHPAIGSMRYALTDVKPPLRFWTLNHFPYAVFYFARSEHIDIVRVLHQSADIPRHLQA